MTNSVKKFRNDVILILSILALALACFLVFRACAKEGTRVVIKIDGEVYKTLSLDTDAVVEVVSGNSGEYKNTVNIKNGKVFVTYANCPDGICENHRAIKYDGESIVCLPHKMIVTVDGGEPPKVDISIK